MSTDKLVTPRRIEPIQALSALFRTPTRLHTPATANRHGKRTRGRGSPLSSSTPTTPGSPPAVVLQTYSVSTDSIVLTALSSAPFCCHEDLLTMSRAQLESIVRILNTRLPSRMRICPEDDFWENDARSDTAGSSIQDDGLSRMSETEMRERIEELVGIRPVVGKNRVSRFGLGVAAGVRVPPAPKAVRTRSATWRPFAKTPWEMDVDDQADNSSSVFDEALMGSSPLANRNKSGAHTRGRSDALSRLPILQEENEGNESREENSGYREGRPSKRSRVSPADTTQYSWEGFHVMQVARESRLVENMDISGSPLLGGDNSAPSDDSAEPDDKEHTTKSNTVVCEKMTEKGAQAPLQYRRSARIQEIVQKRASSVSSEKKTSFDASCLKSTILRSRTFSTRRSSNNGPSPAGPDARKGSNTPKEISIRLPFPPTPPHQERESSLWSAPRLLRSRSHRLPNSNKSTETIATLGRSRSERYPRASESAFVTVDRPRYRSSQRRSNEAEVTKAGQESQVASPPLQQDLWFDIDYLDRKPECEKELNGPNEVSEIYTTSGQRIGTGTLLSARGPFSLRSRAHSTSTITTTSSTASSLAREGTTGTANTIFALNDGTPERILEALGRMAVDF